LCCVVCVCFVVCAFSSFVFLQCASSANFPVGWRLSTSFIRLRVGVRCMGVCAYVCL
jgi:hypothetical protein